MGKRRPEESQVIGGDRAVETDSEGGPVRKWEYEQVAVGRRVDAVRVEVY